VLTTIVFLRRLFRLSRLLFIGRSPSRRRLRIITVRAISHEVNDIDERGRLAFRRCMGRAAVQCKA
jgi:hypothetical protein